MLCIHTITTGGGKKFTSFPDKELFPHINATCPASSTRILPGHSLAGLIASDILLNHSRMFDYYAALGSSRW
ncbi:MAG: alpha/beta hydrolase-fold protein [Chitinophagaceae bacterium]